MIGHELLKGRQLYADLWDHKPPAIHATYALAELVTGYGPQQLYLLHMAALTITLIGLYQAGTLLGGSRAGLCTAVVWAIGSIFPHWEGYNPNTEVFLNALLVWGFYFLCRLNSTPRWSLAWAFGAAIGIASLYKQVVIAPAALLGLAYILGSGPEMRDRWLAMRAHARGSRSEHRVVGRAASPGFGAREPWRTSMMPSSSTTVITSAACSAQSGGGSRIRHKSYLLAVVIPCLLVPLAAPTT